MAKIVDPVLKREELLTASLKVIARLGLNQTTLRRVAQEAGCTTGTLTHYYPHRSTLLFAALEWAQASAARRMIGVAREASSDGDRLRRTVLEALPLDDARVQEWRIWLAYWGAAPGHPMLVLEHEERYGAWRELLTVVLAPLCASAEQVVLEVDTLLALIDGLGIRVCLARAVPSHLAAERRAIVATVDRYMAGLMARTAGGVA